MSATAETRLSRVARRVLVGAGAFLLLLAAWAALGLLRPEPDSEGRSGMAVRVALALATVAAGLTLYAAELAIWFTAERDGGGARMTVIRRLREQGVRAFPPMAPRWALVDQQELLELSDRRETLLPLAPPSRSVVVDCREGDQDWLVYDTDEHGFHNPAGAWSGDPELLLVGDSMTNGACVPSAASMAGRLRERHPRTLNLGVNGNGPLFMLGALREALPERRPRHVLWVYYAGNDLLDLRVERAHPVLRRYLEPGFRQGLLRRQAEIDAAVVRSVERALEERWWERRHAFLNVALLRALRARTARLGPLVAPGVRFPDFETTDEEYALFARVLEEARATSAAAGARLSFVYLPSWTELFGTEANRALSDPRRRRVQELVARAGFPLADVHAAFAAAGDRGLFACANCHYGLRGYALAAQVVGEMLARLDAEPPPAPQRGERSLSSTAPLAAVPSGS